MATFTKRFLSGSTNGRPILIPDIATPGTLVHTAVAGVTDSDEVWLYVSNTYTGIVDLVIEFGGVIDPGDTIRLTVAFKAGLFLVVPGLILQNSLNVRAFANVANVISFSGFVNRITA
jgi:hypothetical protein